MKYPVPYQRYHKYQVVDRNQKSWKPFFRFAKKYRNGDQGGTADREVRVVRPFATNIYSARGSATPRA
eukprot:710691-Pleurochrysis_carterae.AAC.1